MTATFVDSHADFPEDRVSYSVLKEMAKSPADAMWKKANPTKPTSAMDFGKGVDDYLFNEAKDIAVHPDGSSTRTKAFMGAKEAHGESGLYVSMDQWDAIEACGAAVKSSSLFQEHMIDQCHYQVHAYFEEECGKHRQVVANVLDVLEYDGDSVCAITDLKVVSDNSQFGFKQMVNRMRWDLQAASYVRNIQKITNERCPFYWFAVSSTQPHSVVMYEMASDWVDVAETELIGWIREWHKWKDVGMTPDARCLSVVPIQLETPPWRI